MYKKIIIVILVTLGLSLLSAHCGSDSCKDGEGKDHKEHKMNEMKEKHNDHDGMCTDDNCDMKGEHKSHDGTKMNNDHDMKEMHGKHDGKGMNREHNMKKMNGEHNFYSFSAKSINGVETSMEEYKGKLVLVVNTASKCGLTPQYEGLEALYKKYEDKGLVILGFPSNNFAKQEPGTDKEIKEFCSINYGVTFPMFSKIDVNGDNTDPLYRHLKKKKPGLVGESIKWNFTKFLINKEGEVIERFSPTTTPEKIEKDIIKYLK